MALKKYETIKVEREDGITWVIFNRPDKRNAMSPQLHIDMDDVLDELAIDDETDILVVTGAGPAFSAGQDIRLYFRGTESDPAMRAKARRASNQWRWQKLSTFPKPTIAMVNGFCFGGAFTQVCACDFAVAADDATFARWRAYSAAPAEHRTSGRGAEARRPAAASRRPRPVHRSVAEESFQIRMTICTDCQTIHDRCQAPRRGRARAALSSRRERSAGERSLSGRVRNRGSSDLHAGGGAAPLVRVRRG